MCGVSKEGVNGIGLSYFQKERVRTGHEAFRKQIEIPLLGVGGLAAVNWLEERERRLRMQGRVERTALFMWMKCISVSLEVTELGIVNCCDGLR